MINLKEQGAAAAAATSCRFAPAARAPRAHAMAGELAVAGMEELNSAHARRISGGNPVVLAAGVAIAGLMLTAAAAGLKFGYTVLGPWVMDQN